MNSDNDGVIAELEQAKGHLERAHERVRTGTLTVDLMRLIAPITGAIYGLVAELVSAILKKIVSQSEVKK